jgi:hypothetical protein
LALRVAWSPPPTSNSAWSSTNGPSNKEES